MKKTTTYLIIMIAFSFFYSNSAIGGRQSKCSTEVQHLVYSSNFDVSEQPNFDIFDSVCKPLPQDDNQILSSVLVLNENFYFIWIVSIIDKANTEVLATYKEYIYEDATIRVEKGRMWLDTAPYMLTDTTRAVGVRLDISYSGSCMSMASDGNHLTLFDTANIKDKKLRPILTSLPMTYHRNRGDVFCSIHNNPTLRKIHEQGKSYIQVLSTKTNGYNDLRVITKTKVIYYPNRDNEQIVLAEHRYKNDLKFDGESYLKGNHDKIPSLEFNEIVNLDHLLIEKNLLNETPKRIINNTPLNKALKKGMSYPEYDSVEAAISFKENMQEDLDVVLDKPWQQKTLIDSDDSDRYRYHPMGAVVNSSLYLLYVEKNAANQTISIYENNIITGENHEVYSTKNTDLMFYAAEIDIKDEKLIFSPDRKKGVFYCYNIGSANAIYECDIKVRSRSQDDEPLVSPNNRYTVLPYYSVSSSMKINKKEFNRKIKDWEVAYEAAVSRYIDNPSSITYGYKTVILNDYKNYKSEMLFSVGHADFLIGRFSWANDSNAFYFDNSGAFACIWEYDIVNKKLQKIVPEHEAESPFYINFEGRDFIIYLEGNNIKIATP
ncbi:hypothetical protein [Marinomonas sp. THO17]|uniref:hypothetical protein n=1 Tax=Marinomonas sp. THO17 TaxID=3149048 RepID=UPI00336BD385